VSSGNWNGVTAAGVSTISFSVPSGVRRAVGKLLRHGGAPYLGGDSTFYVEKCRVSG
jgi:hypothetical protein